MAQNLVPNPSFEEYNFCSNLNQGPGWPHEWFTPNQGGSPDYFNQCSDVQGVSVPINSFGYQHAHSGGAYVGIYAFQPIVANVREYVSVELFDGLESGKRYVFKGHFSLSNVSTYKVVKLGILLSQDPPSNLVPLYETPPTIHNIQPIFGDTAVWALYTDTLVAEGQELFLTIGCFFNDSLCDTTRIQEGTISSDKAYYYIDDVSLVHLDSLLSVSDHSAMEVEIYPNPSADRVTLRSRETLTAVQLTDLHGRRLWPFEKRSGVLWETQVGKLPNGIYLIEATAADGRRAVRKVVKGP